MIDPYDWCCLGQPPAKTSEDIWHAVRQQSPTTVCGIPAANPDEEWRWVDELGDRRPCDNCTEIIARKADAEQP
jgi:hypothetical protein